MNIYTVKSTDIVHNTSVDLITRWSTKEVHIVQYDNSQPIVAVELFKNSERFVLPDGYEANLRFGKKDRTFIYKPVLGCNQGRDTVYFAVDEQMSMFYGKVTPIIELTYNGAVVGSSSIPFVIDRNPIQIGDVESKSDYPAIVERISATEAAASDAKKAVDTEAVERAAGDAKTLSDARAYTDSSTSGLVSDSTTIKSNITTLQSDVASLKTDNTQNKTDISTLKGNYTAIQSQVNTNSSDITTKQDKLVSGTNIKSINGQSLLGSGDMTVGLPSPWVVDETVLGIKSGQGNEDHTGLINMSGFLIGYGAMRYNGEDPSKIFLFLPTFSSEDTAIVNYSSFDDGIESYVKLPTDFITKSQEINLGDINTNKAEIANKQDKLVSGTNIKTINGNSILGTGDIIISGGGTNYITETTDTLVLKPVNTNGNNFEVRNKTDDVVVSFTQNAPGNSSSYDLFSVILSTAPNEDGEIYNIVARFTKDENWDAKLNLSANAGAIGASFDITIPPDAYGNIAMASDLEPLKTSIGNKQDTLVSGTNIKTINGESILGSGNITINGSSGGSEYFDIHPTNITSTPNNNLEFNITESEYNEILTNKRNVNWVLPAGPEPTSSDETIGIKFEYYTNPGLLYNSAGPVFKSTIVENYNPTVSSNSTLSYATLMLFKDGKSYRGRYSEHCVYRGITMISNEAGYGLILTDKPYNPDKPYEGAVYFGKINGRSVIDNDFELQPTLVSGTNIKTINGESILGSGDITISGGSGSGSGRPPLYSHTITLKDSGNSAYFTFTIYVRTDEEITKDTLFDYLNWNVCSGIGVVSNALIDKIKFSTRADSTWVHQFLELSGQHIDKELSFGNVFGTDFTVEDIVRGPDWIPPR